MCSESIHLDFKGHNGTSIVPEITEFPLLSMPEGVGITGICPSKVLRLRPIDPKYLWLEFRSL